jgi:hypothetical protein
MNSDLYLELLLAGSLLIYPIYTAISIWRSSSIDPLSLILLVWPANVGVGVFVTYLFEATEWMIGAQQGFRTYLSLHLFFLACAVGVRVCRLVLGPRLRIAEDEILSADPIMVRRWLWIALSASAGVRLYNFLVHGVLVSGTRGGSDYSYFEFVFGSIVSSVEPLCIIVVVVAWAQRKLALWERTTSLIALCLFQLLEGRAPFLFVLFLLFYVEINAGRRIKKRTAILGAGAFLTTFLVVFPYFKSLQYGIRYKSDVVSKIEWGDVMEIIGSVARGELASDAHDLQDFNRRDLGATGRFYWLTWNSMVLDGVSRNGAILGGAIKNDVLFLVPRVFKGMRLETDNYMQEALGLPLFDATTNIVAIAYSDFGYAGCVLYGFTWPLALGAFFLLAANAGGHRPLITMLFYILLLRSCFNFENSVSITFVPIRGAVLFALPLWFIAWREHPRMKLGFRGPTVHRQIPN